MYETTGRSLTSHREKRSKCARNAARSSSSSRCRSISPSCSDAFACFNSYTKACAVSPFPSELAPKVKEVGSEGGGRTASDWETRWASEFIVVFSVDEAAPRSVDLRADTSVRGGDRGCAT